MILEADSGMNFLRDQGPWQPKSQVQGPIKLFDDIYDIRIFQQMPVYARVEVLRGKVLCCDDRQFLYDKVISSDLKLEMPENGEDIIENPAYRIILDKEMAENFRRMKGFRNIVVHRYGRIDDIIAYSILRTNLDDSMGLLK